VERGWRELTLMGAATATVLGVRLRAHSRPEAIQTLREFIAGSGPHSVYFVHAATANLAFEDPGFREVLNRGDLVLNDGVGVKWAARLAGVALDENLVGTDLIPQLLAAPFPRPLRVYLLGGRPGVAARAAAHLASRFPHVELAGWADGYFPPAEEAAVVERIRRAAPDLLLVGMGNPHQERFIDRHLARLGCRVAMGVGGLFDHWAGRLRRASPVLRRCGLEWLQLLVQQPHKWRRYLIGNPIFVWRATRPLLRSTLLIGLSVLFSLATAELVVRCARPQVLERYPEGLYLPSASRQYRLRPGFRGVFRYPEFTVPVRINHQGLRAGRDYGPPPAGRRILALGDSFTMGYSVREEQTWAKILETRLGPPWEVLNAGVPGYSTWQELAWLEEEGLALRPQIVLLGFFLGNDVADNAGRRLPVEMRDGRLVAAGVRPLLLPLARNSHLYHLAWRARRRDFPRPEAGEDGWLATAGLIDRLARLSRRHGLRLIVVIMPDRGPEHRNLRLVRVCDRAGVEAVDLTAALRGRGLYFAQDGHWTELGNRLAAQRIGEYLAP
jgi:N-acetylglucosaminyldiphosphoundecaprenol N-acetyl-beta-D-mannosaminyltransferase